MLTEPVSPQAHAGLLSMHAGGFPLRVRRGRHCGRDDCPRARADRRGRRANCCIDTPAGPCRAPIRCAAPAPHAQCATVRISSVAVTGVPSFVHSAGLPVQIGTRDGHSRHRVRRGVLRHRRQRSRRHSDRDGATSRSWCGWGSRSSDAVEASVNVVHPVHDRVKGIHGTIFTGAPRTNADLRSATVLEGGVLRRSPGATGTAALMAVLDAMGLLVGGSPVHTRRRAGTTLKGRVVGRHRDGRRRRRSIRGRSKAPPTITGFHEFTIDD